MKYFAASRDQPVSSAISRADMSCGRRVSGTARLSLLLEDRFDLLRNVVESQHLADAVHVLVVVLRGEQIASRERALQDQERLFACTPTLRAATTHGASSPRAKRPISDIEPYAAAACERWPWIDQT